LTAVLSLALGIGATTTIYTVANALLLRAPAGVRHPETLVDVVRLERGDTGVDPVSYPDYVDVRRRIRTVNELYAHQLEVEPVSLRTEDSTERAFANLVTANYFTALGVRAASGRLLGPGESDEPGASPVAVLSYRFWERRFAASPAVVGRTVRLNGQAFTVIGVAGEGFTGTGVLAPDLWVPIGMVGVIRADTEGSRLRMRENAWLMVGGRLAPGASRAQASAEVAAIGAALAQEFPFDRRILPPGMAVPVFDWSVEPASPVPYGLRSIAALLFTFLMTIVGVVLVIACANVAGILLTRATVRRREMAVRTAIGAWRGRLLRQLLTEVMVLFAFAGIAGLALARVLTTLVTKLLPAFALPVDFALPLDVRVAAFSVAVSLAAAVLCGLAPALHASKADVVSGLKDEGQGPLERMRLRNALVVAQVAFSTLSILVAATLVRGYTTVNTLDRGFDPRGVDLVTVDLSMAGYTSVTGPRFARTVVDRLRQLPDVTTAAVADRAPEPGSISFGNITVPGVTPPRGASAFQANWTVIEPGYFATLRLPIRAGRDFGPGDDTSSEQVAILGESAARRFWPGQDPIGRSIVTHTGEGRAVRTVRRVVGVVRDVSFGTRAVREGREPAIALYVPLQQHYVSRMTFLARSRNSGPGSAALRAVMATADRNLALLNLQTLESQQLGPAQAQLRIGAAVAGIAGLVGLLLAAIGVYGVTAHTVTRRTREIGVRLSLGASRGSVMRLVLRQGLTLIAIGSTAGIALGLAAGLVLSRGALRVPPPDLQVCAATVLLLGVVALMACYVPVRRAAGLRATDALRHE
jgi:predicted permease